MAESLAPIENPNEAVVGTGVPPVIAPGHTFGSVTDKISSIVLTRKAPLGWWLGFLLAFAMVNVLFVAVAVGVTETLAVAVAVAVAVALAVVVAVAVGVGEADPQGLTGQLKISIEAMMFSPAS